MTTTALPGYGLERPTEESCLASLASLFGADTARQVWDAACAATNVDRSGPLALADLRRVGEFLAAQRGPVSVMGAAINVRIKTYDALARRMRAAATESSRRETT